MTPAAPVRTFDVVPDGQPPIARVTTEQPLGSPAARTGADHVALQVLTADEGGGGLPRAEWRESAGVFADEL